MNFMEFACRGIVRNEDNVRRLNKNMVKLAKCVNGTNNAILLLAGAGMLATALIYANAKDIKTLQKQVKDLTHEVEELKEQKGA